jgi:hypothetical protein
MLFVRIYDLISPITQHWFKKPEYQWLKSTAITANERSIIHTLSRFEDLLKSPPAAFVDTERVLSALSTLSHFFFSVARRSDPFFSKREALPPNSAMTELDFLREFQETARRLALAAVFPEELPEKRGRWLYWIFYGIFRLIRSRVVRVALTVSGIAAIVMVFGVLFFGIGEQQAFLTWFSVTFGSLTISVGISSVLIKRDTSLSDAPRTKK